MAGYADPEFSEETRRLLKAVVEPIVARFISLETHLTGAMERLERREAEMAKIHDDIKQALAECSADHNQVDAKIGALIALKDEGDSAFSDILELVQSQGRAMKATSEGLDSVLGAKAVAGAAADQTAHTADDLSSSGSSLNLTSLGTSALPQAAEDGSTAEKTS